MALCFGLGVSLAAYLVSALILALVLLCFSWNPVSSARPMTLYALTYGFIVWLAGAWILPAAIPTSAQLRHRMLTVLVAGLHALAVFVAVYWIIYGRSSGISNLDWSVVWFVAIFATGGALGGLLYVLAIRLFRQRI